MSFPSASSSKSDSAQGSETLANGMPVSAAEVPQMSLRKRAGFRWLLRVAFVLVAVIVAGTLVESAAEASDIQAYPPLGQMVDIGGYRLHITCTGSGSPTVVIDAGLGAWSLEWGEVQAGVASSTRVCTYDRAGMGYSEAGPLPRSAEQIAIELHTLLERANIAGPYVMVGHSMGGLPVRVFVDRYPTEVAGVVLIESMSPGQMTQPASQPAPERTASESGGVSLPSLLARIGLVRLLAGQLITQNLPPEVQPAYTAFSVTPRSVQAWVDEGAALQTSLAQADAVRTFGDLPLLVVTGGLEQMDGWQTMQAELLELSSDSRQIVVEHSGHNVQMDRPEAAVAAIMDMVAQVR
ncbi:MAG: alpha/beta hydrolase [Pleurocapsa minor GSE-CHR-MK-17-07R]|jgi:pimeloyl-ACP methyl ester carboxylesterase|nr:alpha/beta hydrolase [Pleurocapsa minor GSE-CHR-MK 17-07R]